MSYSLFFYVYLSIFIKNYFGANIQIKIDIQQKNCIYLPLDDFKD